MSDAAIQAIRKALEVSPDNVPLRQHLADTLLGLSRPGEAEQEYRKALAMAPDDVALKLGLARAFLQQGKYSESLVIVEALLRRPDTPARAYVLHARLLLRAGEVERAVRQYREGVGLDAAAADPELAAQLGVGADESRDEVSEGKVRAAWEAPPAQDTAEVERPAVGFADVGGMDAVKDEVRMKIIHPLTHPDLYKAYGKPIGGGILLYGPPGCGKPQPA
jgi:SpoVK/Ycf46/Vps4 family AAA+-type ATPase